MKYALLLLCLAGTAWAGHPDPTNPNSSASADAVSGSESRSAARSIAVAGSAATSETVVDASSGAEVGVETNVTVGPPTATTGPVTQGVDVDTGSAAAGAQIEDNSDYDFLALSLMFPNASGCFKGAQGGMDNKDDFAGFLGLHWLDKNCWADTLASRERDADINARLKCGGRFYRNAVAFDVPRKERQQTCVDRVKASYKALIEQENDRLEALLQDELAKQANTINTHTSTEAQGTRRAIEVCTDCYGAKAK